MGVGLAGVETGVEAGVEAGVWEPAGTVVRVVGEAPGAGAAAVGLVPCGDEVVREGWRRDTGPPWPCDAAPVLDRGSGQGVSGTREPVTTPKVTITR